MKRLLLCLLLIGSFAVGASAQANEYRTFEINWQALSYSQQGELEQYGGSLDFAVFMNRRVAIVVDAGIHFPSETALDFKTTTVRVGPRLQQVYGSRITAFGQFLVGGVRISGRGNTVSTSESISGFAMYGGGGFDVGIAPWFAWRTVEAGYSGFSIDGGWSSGVRLSTGIVFRFGKM